MPIKKNSVRRQGSIIRDNAVHKMLDELYNELGDLKHEVSRGYLFHGQ